MNSASPTETQQALYSLPQSDYNVITSGSNGYSAASGYNLVTGLGTPVANLLVADLVAYQGPDTSYAGPTVAALQSAELVNSEASAGASGDVFSVFDSFTLTSSVSVHAWASAAGAPNPGSQSAGQASRGVFGQNLNIVYIAIRSEPPTPLREYPAQGLAPISAAIDAGFASPEFAVGDDGIALDATTRSMNRVARIRLRSRPAGDGKTIRTTLTPLAPVIDRAAVLALLETGWSPRSHWIEDRPRASIDNKHL